MDPLAAAFGSNENDRALVREWLAIFGDFAARRGCAVLLIGHPAKVAAGEASRYSGSTDWRNGVRALWTLTTEKVGGREKPKPGETTDRAHCLTLDKSSYSPQGARAWLRLDGDGTGKGLA